MSKITPLNGLTNSYKYLSWSNVAVQLTDYRHKTTYETGYQLLFFIFPNISLLDFVIQNQVEWNHEHYPINIPGKNEYGKTIY